MSRPFRGRRAEDLAHLDAQLEVWARLRQRQGDTAAALIATDGLDPQWLAALHRRAEAEGIDGAMASWTQARRRQGDAAAERIATEGVSAEWLAALHDAMNPAGTEVAAGPDSGAQGPRDGVGAVVELAHRGRECVQGLLALARDDERPPVQDAARAALDDVVHLAVDARPRPVPQTGFNGILARLDRIVMWADAAVPVGRRFAHRVRCLLAIAAVGVAGGGAVSLAGGHYPATLVLLVLAMGLDLLEGTLGRVIGESPASRWATRFTTHFADLFFIYGIAWDQQRQGQSWVTVALLVAGSLGLYGSLARMWAHQVSEMSWRFAERAVRAPAFLVYVALSLAGLVVAPLIVAVLTAVVLAALGAHSIIRVGRQVAPIDSVTTLVKIDGRLTSFVDVAAADTRRRLTASTSSAGR